MLTKEEALAKIAISQLAGEEIAFCWQVEVNTKEVDLDCLCIGCVNNTEGDTEEVICGELGLYDYIFFHTKEEAEAYAKELTSVNQ